jgi:hypothetical protein
MNTPRRICLRHFTIVVATIPVVVVVGIVGVAVLLVIVVLEALVVNLELAAAGGLLEP